MKRKMMKNCHNNKCPFHNIEAPDNCTFDDMKNCMDYQPDKQITLI